MADSAHLRSVPYFRTDPAVYSHFANAMQLARRPSVEARDFCEILHRLVAMGAPPWRLVAATVTASISVRMALTEDVVRGTPGIPLGEAYLELPSPNAVSPEDLARALNVRYEISWYGFKDPCLQRFAFVHPIRYAYRPSSWERAIVEFGSRLTHSDVRFGALVSRCLEFMNCAPPLPMANDLLPGGPATALDRIDGYWWVQRIRKEELHENAHHLAEYIDERQIERECQERGVSICGSTTQERVLPGVEQPTDQPGERRGDALAAPNSKLPFYKPF